MSDRTMHTLLYTPKGQAILASMKSAFMHKWPSGQMRHAAIRLNNTEIAPDGEVLLVPTGYFEGPLWNKSDNEILKWLAIHLKLVVTSTHEWYRANDKVVTELSSDQFTVTVSDAYLIYDIWLLRKNIEKHFSKNQIAEVVGVARDPITTEMEIARREEIKVAKQACDDQIAQARAQMYEKNHEFEKKTREEYEARCKKIKEERDAKINEINHLMKAPSPEIAAA